MTEQVFRKCRDCGFEAHTKEDLTKFVTHTESKYNKANWCKECRRKYSLKHNRKYIKKYKNKPRSRLGSCYYHMVRRCYNPKDSSYRLYGARGITICEEWLNDREKFIKWGLENGYKRGLSIDRIDNNQGYRPQNCHFIPLTQQQNNKRNTVTNLIKGTRICRLCKQEKPLIEFHFSNKKQGKRQYACKECKNKYMREWRRKIKLSESMHQ